MDRVPNLPPGTYAVAFDLPGLPDGEARGHQPAALGQSLAVDAQLPIAGVQETLTVTGDAPLVDSRTRLS